MRIFLTAFSLFLALWSGAQDHARYVNIFIGTDGTGHTFPGPSMPFGMVQPGPDNRDQGWDYTSGYQYRDTVLLGFSQTRLSGTGISELGDLLLLPFAGQADPRLKNRYFKESEKASPGYYSVTKKDGVQVELTCTERVAFHRYTFPGREARVLADFQHGLRFLTDSLVLDSEIRQEDDHTMSGYCHTKNWVERTWYFVMKFDHPVIDREILQKGRKENAPKYLLTFDLTSGQVLRVKIAISAVSVDGARGNLEKELPGWDFDRVREEARNAWNQYLDRVDIEAPQKDKEIFYTALYHLLLQPSNIADADGHYRGADGKVRLAPDGAYYSTLSIWDVYRGAFPLLQIIAPEKINAIVGSMLLHHRAAGFLPIWTVWGRDNYCMIGNHAIPMILSAWNNGFRGFDAHEALKAMVETSTRSHINSRWELYERYGYYPFDSLDNEAVSRTLESGYDDWCVARFASQLGDQATASHFYRRAGFYRNLFDTATRLFRGRDTHGNWRNPFDPLTATSPMNNPGDYTEANAWQYFWTPAQFDIEGMKELLGGTEAFTRHLDTFFTLETRNLDKFLGQEAMIGQYAHGNEPGHHILYLYAYTDRPWTGQRYIRKVIRDFHNNTPDGMIGNDDCGQMSAWYILSSLGFYPVNPASDAFVLGAPQIPKARIRLPGGKVFTMEARGLSPERMFTGEVLLNGQPVDKPFITYRQIMGGGTLTFEMTEKSGGE